MRVVIRPVPRRAPPRACPPERARAAAPREGRRAGGGGVRVVYARAAHARFAPRVTALQRWAAQEGASMAVRTPAYVRELMEEGKAVVALAADRLVGFMFLQTWDGGRFVSHSGMVVDPAWRGRGIARRMKEKIVALTRKRFPRASIVSLTTAPEVLAMNRGLGFREVRFADLPEDPEFWRGCLTCPYYESLRESPTRRCCCTAMRLDPAPAAPRRNRARRRRRR